MKAFFSSLLFILSFFSFFLFSFKISKNFLKIKDNLNLFLCTIILNLSILISFANLLLFLKIFKFLFFVLFSIPFFIISYKELKEIQIQRFELKVSFPYKFLLFLFIFIIFFIFQEAIITPPLSWDSLYYHMLQSAKFVQKGSFANIDFDGLLGTFKYHPKNYEVFLSIFLLPYHSDFIANLCNFYFLVIIFFASIIILREFNFSNKRSILFLINFITIPAFFIYLPTQYIEIASLSLIVSGFAFLKVYSKEKNLSFLFLSSLSFVLAFSFKVYNILPYLIGSAFILYFLFKDKKFKLYILAILFFINFLFLIPYFKKIYFNKNPLYPYPLKIFNIDIGKGEPKIIDYLNKIKEKEEEWFSKYSKDLSTLEKKLAPYLYTIFTMFSQNRQGLGRHTLLYFFFGTIGLFFLKGKIWKIFLALQILLFLFQFFSPQMEPLRIMFSLSYSRIFLFPVFFFLLLSLFILKKFKVYEIIFVIGFFTNIFLILPPIFLPHHLFLIIFSFLFTFMVFKFFFKFPRLFFVSFFALFIIISPFLYKIKEKERLYFYMNYYHVSEISKAVLPFATILNGKGAKINYHIIDGYFSPDPILPYPLLGTKFENELIYVSPDGKNFNEWLFALRKEKVDLILLRGEDLKELQWCINFPEFFNLLIEKNGIFLYSLNPK